MACPFLCLFCVFSGHVVSRAQTSSDHEQFSKHQSEVVFTWSCPPCKNYLSTGWQSNLGTCIRLNIWKAFRLNQPKVTKVWKPSWGAMASAPRNLHGIQAESRENQTRLGHYMRHRQNVSHVSNCFWTTVSILGDHIVLQGFCCIPSLTFIILRWHSGMWHSLFQHQKRQYMTNPPGVVRLRRAGKILKPCTGVSVQLGTVFCWNPQEMHT